jgi:hypothetical protein
MKKLLLTALLPLTAFLILSPVFSVTGTAFDPFNDDPNICNQTTVENQKSLVCAPKNPKPITGPNGIINNIANILAFITGVVAVIMIMVGGFQYIQSSGDSAKINKAKNTILFAVIGLVVVVVARSLIVFVLTLL